MAALFHLDGAAHGSYSLLCIAGPGSTRTRQSLLTDFDTSSKCQRRCAELTANYGTTTVTTAKLRPKSGLTVRDTDRMLIACQGGDTEAFSGLYRLTSPQLFGLALRILRRRDWAEEAVQECFVTIWRRAKDYRPDLGPALPWITVILRNK